MTLNDMNSIARAFQEYLRTSNRDIAKFTKDITIKVLEGTNEYIFRVTTTKRPAMTQFLIEKGLDLISNTATDFVIGKVGTGQQNLQLMYRILTRWCAQDSSRPQLPVSDELVSIALQPDTQVKSRRKLQSDVQSHPTGGDADKRIKNPITVLFKSLGIGGFTPPQLVHTQHKRFPGDHYYTKFNTRDEYSRAYDLLVGSGTVIVEACPPRKGVTTFGMRIAMKDSDAETPTHEPQPPINVPRASAITPPDPAKANGTHATSTEPPAEQCLTAIVEVTIHLTVRVPVGNDPRVPCELAIDDLNLPAGAWQATKLISFG